MTSPFVSIHLEYIPVSRSRQNPLRTSVTKNLPMQHFLCISSRQIDRCCQSCQEILAFAIQPIHSFTHCLRAAGLTCGLLQAPLRRCLQYDLMAYTSLAVMVMNLIGVIFWLCSFVLLMHTNAQNSNIQLGLTRRLQHAFL